MSRRLQGILFILIPTIINVWVLSLLPDPSSAFGVSPETKMMIFTTFFATFFPLGVFYLITGDRSAMRLKNKARYQTLDEHQLSFLDNFSWGAYLSGPIWLIVNGMAEKVVWYFVPIYNIFFSYKIAINGRKMAWERTKLDYEDFKRREVIFEAIWSVIFAGLSLLAYYGGT